MSESQQKLTREQIARIQPERDICTESWFFIKKYADLFQSIPGNHVLEDMLALDLERISEMGDTPAQKQLAFYMAISLSRYVEAQYTEKLYPGHEADSSIA